MKSKIHKLVFCVLATLAIASIAVLPVVSATPRLLKQLKLMYSTDGTVWTHVPGNQVSDFKLKLDPEVDYYYLDIMSLKPMDPISNDRYEFFVESYPDGFFEYWATRGVVSGASGWQAIMWEIINGNAPIFYLDVDGTDYMLIDGLQSLAGLGDQPLRVNGDYYLGTYAYTGNVDGNEITVQIIFK